MASREGEESSQASSRRPDRPQASGRIGSRRSQPDAPDLPERNPIRGAGAIAPKEVPLVRVARVVGPSQQRGVIAPNEVPFVQVIRVTRPGDRRGEIAPNEVPFVRVMGIVRPGRPPRGIAPNEIGSMRVVQVILARKESGESLLNEPDAPRGVDETNPTVEGANPSAQSDRGAVLPNEAKPAGSRRNEPKPRGGMPLLRRTKPNRAVA